ncbi:MAG: response regulator transcription factor [Bacteroidaceae bacterium]|nr:response regulator transcription factor [Bacteroidaceae bacterium]
MIDAGMSSKEIAVMLNISIYTVSRHRQNILEKLRAKNSSHACTRAKNLQLI